MPGVSRRTVLTAAGLAAAGAAVGLPRAAAAAGVATRSTFAAAKGSTVTVTDGRVSVRAVLSEVADLRNAPAGDPRRYSILLKPASPMHDGIYTVSSAGIRGTSLFFANVDRRTAHRLEAVVNQFTP